MDNLQNRKKRGKKMVAELRKMFPDARAELNYETHWQFVVAVILSAQCTDKRVNMVTKKLFKKYKTVKDYASARVREFEQDIFSTGFYRNKTKNIISLAKIILKKFDGKIPRDHGMLLGLPGIGRKTAAVILGNLYGINVGIAVDTHVARIARCFDLSDSHNPNNIEHDLMEIFPPDDWNDINRYFVLYGRYCFPARGQAQANPLTKIYPRALENKKNLFCKN